MLAIVLAFLSFGILNNIIAQTYTVDISVNDVWWESKENFGADLNAVIYRDGEPIPPSNDYFYEWYVYFSNEGHWRLLISGNGKDHVIPETMAGYYIKSYVVVSDVVHHTFTGIQSEIKGPFYITGTQPGDIAEIVHFLPYAQDGTNIYNLVSPKHWRYTLNPPQWKTGYRSFLTRGHTEVIKSDPNFVSSINQKFLFWNNNSSNCVNYGKFPIVAGYGDIKAQYWSVYGNVVIQNYFLSANGANPEGDSIGFKDPWLIDYYESPYGLRNQGMDAPFKNRPSPFNPDYTTSYDGDVYQGVFLNKNPQFQQGKPIYFVEAMQEQVISFNNEDILWYFQGWNGTDVQFEHAEQTRTSVVFKQDGAVARAVYKGHLVSSTNRALRNNG